MIFIKQLNEFFNNKYKYYFKKRDLILLFQI